MGLAYAGTMDLVTFFHAYSKYDDACGSQFHGAGSRRNIVAGLMEGALRLLHRTTRRRKTIRRRIERPAQRQQGNRSSIGPVRPGMHSTKPWAATPGRTRGVGMTRPAREAIVSRIWRAPAQSVARTRGHGHSLM
jgi:hypothetical protein